MTGEERLWDVVRVLMLCFVILISAAQIVDAIRAQQCTAESRSEVQS